MIRASIFNVVRFNKIRELIDEDIFECVDDMNETIIDAERYFPHRCNPRCSACVGPGEYRCSKLNNLHVTTDNTNHEFKPFPKSYSNTCLQRLVNIGWVLPLNINSDGY